MAGLITGELFDDYCASLLSGKTADCRQIVEDLLKAGIDIKELYSLLFQASLFRVGELWETNRIAVAVEHMATAITERLMSLAYPALFSGERGSKTAVISCAANEYHQVGGRMAADIFELNGWHSYFLGANTPVDVLTKFIQEKKPDIIGLSMAVYFNMPRLIEALNKITTLTPGIPVFLGGQAFRWGGQELCQLYPNTTFVPSLEALESMIRSI
ncbi:MAG: B12-binding domain-containing protein [Candidatus Xenobiia bacterium LiM19]